jgi:hypothetical protein
MPDTSNRNVQVGFSGTVPSQIIQSALENALSPAESELITLVAGDNPILPPVIAGLVVTGLTIFPPSGNTIVITLKGDPADVGIPLHLTDPFSIGLDPSFTGLVLSTPALSADIAGLRLIWS